MLEVRRLSKQFRLNGDKAITALKDISFGVGRGEFVSIVGPSGCGKSTLLMCMDGLTPPSGGRVLLNGREVHHPPREMTLIFQNYANSLFPWLTVLGNVLFALHDRPASQNEKREIAGQALNGVGLNGFEAYYPWQLSGGMQQRVAIARGLAYGSDIVLMDEPFASVDAQTRSDLEDLLLNVWEMFSKTVLFVTHDIDEAIYLSDRVFIMSERPSVILDTVTVELPRPRSQIDTRADPAFIRLRNDIYATLRP